MATENQGNNLNISSHTGIVKEMPHMQTNTINVDPTPGYICIVAIFIIICVIIGRVDYWANKCFKHRKEIDELELRLKHENKE